MLYSERSISLDKNKTSQLTNTTIESNKAKTIANEYPILFFIITRKITKNGRITKMIG